MLTAAIAFDGGWGRSCQSLLGDGGAAQHGAIWIREETDDDGRLAAETAAQLQ